MTSICINAWHQPVNMSSKHLFNPINHCLLIYPSSFLTIVNSSSGKSRNAWPTIWPLSLHLKMRYGGSSFIDAVTVMAHVAFFESTVDFYVSIVLAHFKFSVFFHATKNRCLIHDHNEVMVPIRSNELLLCYINENQSICNWLLWMLLWLLPPHGTPNCTM